MITMGIGPTCLASQNSVLSSPPFSFLEAGCWNFFPLFHIFLKWNETRESTRKIPKTSFLKRRTPSPCQWSSYLHKKVGSKLTIIFQILSKLQRKKTYVPSHSVPSLPSSTYKIYALLVKKPTEKCTLRLALLIFLHRKIRRFKLNWQ